MHGVSCKSDFNLISFFIENLRYVPEFSGLSLDICFLCLTSCDLYMYLPRNNSNAIYILKQQNIQTKHENTKASPDLRLV